MSHIVNTTSLSLVTCTTDAILISVNKSFKLLQVEGKLYLAFYHHAFLYELLNYASNKGI